MTAPIVTVHDGVHVVRDDLFPGGTKARFVGRLYERADEVVYASSAEGGAQTALAECARQRGRRATIFVPWRQTPHARALMAKRLGANVVQVKPGYLNVIQSRAKQYAEDSGALLAPFGMEVAGAVEAIAVAARETGLEPDEVWCASGSGVLMRGLAVAWPKARRHAVQIGRKLSPADVAGAEIHAYPRAFATIARTLPPFPSDPHYDAKAWEVLTRASRRGLVLMWNVTGPAVP